MAKFLLVFAMVVLSIALTTTEGTVYTVGDSSGWDISTDLDTWSQGKKFVPGDTLLFLYSSSHSVNEVTKQNYQGCNTTDVLQSSSDGNTTIALSRPGDRYFVCGNKLHCLGGMKLHVYVESNQAFAPAPTPEAESGEGTSLPSPNSKSNNPNSVSSAMAIHGGIGSAFLALLSFVGALAWVM